MKNEQKTITNANEVRQSKPNVPTLRFQEFEYSWDQKPFNETFSILTNNTLSRAELNYDNGKYKNIHYGDVLIKFSAHTDVSSADVPYINDENVSPKFDSALLRNGDIVFADTAEDYTVGKVTEIENVAEIKVVSGLHTIPCRPKINFSPRYLGYFLNSPKYHNQLIPYIQGVKVSSISKALIKNTMISYPSLEEQAKIASFLSCLDEKIEVQNKIISKYETLIKGLCDKIFRHNKTASLSDLAICKTSTLQENEVINDSNGQYNVFGASGIIASIRNYQFDKNAILVLKDGSKAGKIQYASGRYSVVGTSVILMPKNEFDAKYLYFAMLALDFGQYKVGSGIPHIYFKDYSSEKIYYPNKLQRNRIERTLTAYETKLDVEKRMLSALQKQKAFLLQSMFI